MANKAIRIGTRGSPLALAQANEVKKRLERAHAGIAVEIIPVKTSGDRIKARPLAEAGGKGLFTKEIEDGLLNQTLDLAVHSAKDLPARLPGGLCLAAVPEREDVRDVLIAAGAETLSGLPDGARLGTSSLRRQAQALNLRPDLELVALRGNVETRLKKVGKDVNAALLACAGLKRLGLEAAVGAILPLEEMLPAPGQGAIAIEAREGDKRMESLLAAISHAPSFHAVALERAVVAGLGASCTMPLAAYATVEGQQMSAQAALFSADGTIRVDAGGAGQCDDAETLGAALAKELRGNAPERLLKELQLY